MQDLNDLYYFVQVVDQKGFSAAGRALNMPKSSLSRRIIELEARLGVRLIQRTTRSFVVTEIGREFYRHAQAMLIEAQAAEAAVQRRLAEPSGTVRFTCAAGMASALSGLLSRFLLRYPKVSLTQHATNRFVDLVEEGFDAGLRGHIEPLPNSSLIQRPLVRTLWGLFAAPSYLERAGTPLEPADLSAHAGLALNPLSGDAVWKLRHVARGEDEVVPVTPRLVSDDLETLRTAAVAGLGVVGLPAYLCADEVEAKTLRRVLPEWTAGEGQLTLLLPSRRGLLPAVRAFSDFIAAEYPKVVALPGAV